MNNNPIYLLDSDYDDYEFAKEVFSELGVENDFFYFKSGDELIKTLHAATQPPFIIICDVNLFPKDGYEVREKLIENPVTKYPSVPFIFWSNTASKSQIQKAYDVSAHGFFLKGNQLEDMKKTLKCIVEYWQRSLIPD